MDAAGKAVAYVRVSTEDQKLGPSAQRKAIQRWADAQGVEIVSWHEEHISGGAPLEDRAALLTALAELKTLPKGSALVVAKRDRIARDVVISVVVDRITESSGHMIISADGSGNGTSPEAAMMRGIVGVFAAYERDLIKSRTKAALAAKKAKGERTGQIPYGSQLAEDGISLRPHPHEQHCLSVIRELRASGVSIRGIVVELEKRGLAPRGAKWHATSVARILKAK